MGDDTKDTKDKGKGKEDSKVNVLLNTLARRLTHPIIPWTLNRLKKQRRDLWNQLAHVFIRGSKTTRETLFAGFQAIALGAENLVNAMSLPHVVNDVIEHVMSNMTVQVGEYFERDDHRRDFEAIEATLKPWNEKDVRNLGNEVAQFFKNQLQGFLEWIQSVLHLGLTWKVSSQARFSRSLMVLPDEWLVEFAEFWANLKPEDKVIFRGMVGFFDEERELITFLTLPPNIRNQVFEILKTMRGPGMWKRLEAFIKTTDKTVDAFLTKHGQAVNRVLAQAHEEFSQANDDRRAALLADRYTLPNLVRYPFRANEPECSPEARRELARHQARQRQAQRRRPGLVSILFICFLIASVVSIVVGAIIPADDLDADKKPAATSAETQNQK